MKILSITKNFNDLDIIKDMMYTSLPIDEQSTIEELLKLCNEKTQFNAYYDNNNLIGFSYTYNYDDMQFLYYLVISEKYRQQGYGSKILSILKNNNENIILNAEAITLNENSSTNKRISFYKRNGFYDTGYILLFDNVSYSILASKNIDVNKYKNLLESFSNIYSNVNINQKAIDL